MRTFKGFVCLSWNWKPAFDDIPFYRLLRIWTNIFPTNLLFCLIFYWCHITVACPGFCPWNSSSWDKIYLTKHIHLHNLIHNILQKTSKFLFSTLIHLPQPQTHCFRFIPTSYKHFKLIIFQAEVVKLSPLLLVSWILLFFLIYSLSQLQSTFSQLLKPNMSQSSYWTHISSQSSCPAFPFSTLTMDLF